jgi:malate synthase
MTDIRTVEPAGIARDLRSEVLTPGVLTFLSQLHERFEHTRLSLLDARAARYDELASGGSFGFLAETDAIRSDPDWKVASPAPGLIDRRAEITGPTERKMTINALNSGAKVWLADFEDANTPLWQNMLEGQANLLAAITGTIGFISDEGKEYSLRTTGSDTPTIVVRPRGWHLSEKHLLIGGERISASLFDFGVYFYHCARLQLERGSGPYFYLPKMESHREARLWNDVFAFSEEFLGLEHGTIRATVLIETFPAAFEMEEILFELRDYSAGLNAGRWDYMFSAIKKLRTRGTEYVLPDRNSVSMTVPFMRAYTELLVSTCHRRGAHAIGGMAAFIPNRRDTEVNAAAFAKVLADKTREANDGFDGSWVAHPDMVALCTEAFDSVLGSKPNQLDRLRDDVHVTAAELLDIAGTAGQVTEAGLRSDIRVALIYIESWLGGQGAVGVDNMMEDAATAEISRAQVWQWIANSVTLADGRTIDRPLVENMIDEELTRIRSEFGEARFAGGRFADAVALFRDMALSERFTDFLTLPAYEQMP